ncbi:MAG: hypothetical protein KDB00_03550 [Planctomycetales bacterium]|nr:hypothetical protein [Planctomycetales bacterium]
MNKITQKESYPGSVEFLLWNESWSDTDFMNFYEFASNRFPLVMEPGRNLGISGKRWKVFFPTEDFPSALKRRGTKDLRCVIFRELEPRLDIRFDRADRRCGRLSISCSSSEWDAKGGHKIIHELLDILEADYGHFNLTKYFNIDHSHRIAAAPTFGGPSINVWEQPKDDTLLPVSQYENLLDVWEFDRGYESKNPSEYVARPLLVYPVSVLTQQHLELMVLNDQCLREWIEHKTERGSLTRANSRNFLWEVKEENIEKVVRNLWTANFFNASEYFEIGSWDSELQLPLLRHIKKLDRDQGGTT